MSWPTLKRKLREVHWEKKIWRIFCMFLCKIFGRGVERITDVLRRWVSWIQCRILLPISLISLKVSPNLSVEHPNSLFPLWFPIKIFCMFLISPFLAQHTSWNRLSPWAPKVLVNNSVCRNRSILTRELYATDKLVTTSALYCEVYSLRRRGGKPGVTKFWIYLLHPSKICEVFYSRLPNSTEQGP